MVKKKPDLCHCGSFGDAYAGARRIVQDMFLDHMNDKGPCGVFTIAVSAAVIQLCGQICARLEADDGTEDEVALAKVSKMISEINAEMEKFLDENIETLANDVETILAVADRADATLN